MQTNHPPTTQSLLKQISDITTMQRGKLTEEYRTRTAKSGTDAIRLGPYFKLQAWENGHNVSRRVPVSEVPTLKEALAGLPPASTTPLGSSASIPVLYVSADGTGVPMRREALAGRSGKQKDGSARTREAKLGCVYTQTGLDQEGQPLRDPDSTSYVGTFKGCRDAGILLRQEAVRRGLGRAEQIGYIGDGAAWVWENCRLNFPGALEILDFYHACEHVGQLAKALHDTDPTEAALQQTQWCKDMKEDSPAAMLTEVTVLLAAHPNGPIPSAPPSRARSTIFKATSPAPNTKNTRPMVTSSVAESLRLAAKPLLAVASNNPACSGARSEPKTS
ncbi:MAG: hypothetical protein ACI9R3_006352 [Verrucomicrobiales bacterium]|jgi:hypothetical protein